MRRTFREIDPAATFDHNGATYMVRAAKDGDGYCIWKRMTKAGWRLLERVEAIDAVVMQANEVVDRMRAKEGQ